MIDLNMMVVSPSGKLYMVQNAKKDKKLLWTYQDESHFFSKAEGVEDYVNTMENGDGGLQLRRYRRGIQDGEEFCWNTDDEVKRLLSREFGENNSLSWSIEKVLYFKKNGKKIEEEEDDCYVIRKREHNILGVRPDWRLRYTTYEVTSVLFGRHSPLNVHQYQKSDSLLNKLCTELRLKDERVVSDIWVCGIKNELINVGKNISGTVYEGDISGWPVAVKKYPADHVFPEVVRKLWNWGAAGKLPYILHPRAAQVAPKGYNIAFERCSLTLHEWLSQPSVGNIEEAVSTLIDGIIALHVMGITHGSINPWTVLIVDGKARISGFKSCKFSTNRYDREKDSIDVGRLIVHIYQQTRPAGETEAMYANKYKDVSARNMMHGWAGAARKLADRLIDFKISLRRAGEHTLFWTYEKRVIFIFEVAGYLEDLSKKNYNAYLKLMKLMKLDTSRYYDGGDWQLKIPQRVRQSSKSSYSPNEPIDVLFFMRNTLAHYGEISRSVKNPKFKRPIGIRDLSFIGTNGCGLEKSFQDEYPKYLATLYEDIESTQNHNALETGLLGRFYDFI